MSEVGLEEWISKANEARKKLKADLAILDERVDNLRKSTTLLTKRVYKLENPPIPAIKGTKKGKKSD